MKEKNSEHFLFSSYIERSPDTVCKNNCIGNTDNKDGEQNYHSQQGLERCLKSLLLMKGPESEGVAPFHSVSILFLFYHIY